MIFVIIFKMDVAGVAYATVISQVVSATMVVVLLIKETDDFHLDLRKLKMNMHIFRKIVKIGLRSSSGGKGFVKGDAENFVVEEQKRQHHHDGEHNAQPDLRLGQGQDGGGAEQGGAHIAGQIGRGGKNVHQQITDGQGTHGDHGNGGISLDLGILPRAQQ